ncbi:unnamed protein product [Nippostrongylus brasiliensis]|uniref:Histone H2A n=1 Tax=Nippostrongylus brasiliensis TaxID=27835 RepID=A0A0N4YV49_NIPBR|nr:unnamed protein product [Nippostrongylus brasiliensis]
MGTGKPPPRISGGKKLKTRHRHTERRTNPIRIVGQRRVSSSEKLTEGRSAAVHNATVYIVPSIGAYDKVKALPMAARA